MNNPSQLQCQSWRLSLNNPIDKRIRFHSRSVAESESEEEEEDDDDDDDEEEEEAAFSSEPEESEDGDRVASSHSSRRRRYPSRSKTSKSTRLTRNSTAPDRRRPGT